MTTDPEPQGGASLKRLWPIPVLIIGFMLNTPTASGESYFLQATEMQGLMVDDDDISAETFASLGSLTSFVEEKLAG